MKLEFKDIVDKYKSKPALVMASGPSLDAYKGNLAHYKDNGVILVGCNEWYTMYDVTPHYWVLANTIITLPREKDMMNQRKATVVYADSVDLTDRGWIEQNLQCDWMGYDQRHFSGYPCCDKKCCHHIVPGRLTIQEELQRWSAHTVRYGSGDTVALHCITTAVLLGCNPVYVVGMDLDYRLGYSTNNANLVNLVPPALFDEFMDRILADLTKIRESAEKKGTRIINLNKNSRFKELEIGEMQNVP